MATGLSALGSRRSSLAGVSALVQRSNDAFGNLNAFAAQTKAQNFRQGTAMEMNANSQMAEQKIQKMNWEKLQPYMRKLQSAQSMMGAGMQNMFGGVTDAVSMYNSSKQPYNQNPQQP
jgi:hypothetical protein